MVDASSEDFFNDIKETKKGEEEGIARTYNSSFPLLYAIQSLHNVLLQWLVHPSSL
jgi:hypothetical protein